MKIEFHEHAWKCPTCHRYHRIRFCGCNVRVSKCCGHKVKVRTTLREIIHRYHAITSVEDMSSNKEGKS